MGAEEAWRGSLSVGLPLLQDLQPGHPHKGGLVSLLWEVILKQQGDDTLGPYCTWERRGREREQESERKVAVKVNVVCPPKNGEREKA
jgi:hypothetical protein